MKKIFYIITLATLVLACNNLNKNEFLITGSVKGMDDGVKIYLNTQGENGFQVKDSAIIQNEKFNLKGNIESPEIGFIKISTNNGDFPFILENGKINIELNKDTIQISKLSGTMNNEKLQSYNDESKLVFNKIIKYNTENQMVWIKAKKENDSATMNRLNSGLKSFQQELNDVSVRFVKNNPEAFLSVLLIENFVTRQHLPVEEIKILFGKINKEYSNSKSALNIKKILNEYSSLESNPEIIKAQEFSAKNPDGKEISLKESLGKVTIIDFWASWCGPCKAMEPHFEAVAEEYADEPIQFLKLNTEVHADLAASFNIRSLPTMVMVHDGRILDLSIGSQNGRAIAKKADWVLAKARGDGFFTRLFGSK